uniref:Uncharacterized protein n=1 Tax=Anguilla anguilla TaxID=7936 RepID=A0A0E9XWE1_ANGAN
MLYSTYLAIHVATVVSPSLAHITFFYFYIQTSSKLKHCQRYFKVFEM